MKSFNLKVRYILIPFLSIAAGFIAVYSFLNIWLSIDTGKIPLKEEVTDLWLPLALPIIPLLIWLNPRLKILNLTTKNRRADLPFLYLFIATLAIGIPALLLQSYLRIAMGKMTPLTSISQIRVDKPTRYYRVNQYYIDTTLAAFKNTAEVSGKHNEHLNYTISIACPVYDRQVIIAPPSGEETKITPRQDTTAAPHDKEKFILPQALVPEAWICVNYKEQISNRLETAERKEKWKAFFNESIRDFRSKDLKTFNYLERIGNTDDRDNYQAAIKQNSDFSSLPAPLFILVPRYDEFKERTGNKLGWVFGAFGIIFFIWLIMLAIPKLNESAIKVKGNTLLIKKKKANSTDLKEMGLLLLPREGYAAIPIIMDLNILIFLLMLFTGMGFINFQAADLLTWGANYRPLTVGAHQWWRLLTSAFLHAGILHLVFNIAGLMFAGFLLEPVLGKGRLTAIYLITAIVSSLASLWWHPATVSVGASGAIFGLFGVLLALLSTKFFTAVIKRSLGVAVIVFVGGNLLMGLSGGIDNAAHIGGLLSGAIIGYILYPRLKKEKGGQEENPADSKGVRWNA
jgi:rhomboid protease GluP